MKSFLLAAVLLLVSVTPGAQTTASKPVVCGPVTEVIAELRSEQFNEQPIWYGADSASGTHFSLFTNIKSRTWTFIQFDKDIACILGTGSGSKVTTGIEV